MDLEQKQSQSANENSRGVQTAHPDAYILGPIALFLMMAVALLPTIMGYYENTKPYQDRLELAKTKATQDEKDMAILDGVFYAELLSSDVDGEWRKVARESLDRQIKKGNPGILTEYCGGKYKDYVGIISACPEISQEETQSLIAYANADRQQQALPAISQQDFVDIAKKNQAHYFEGYWRFPSYAAKQAFLKEINPYRRANEGQ